MEVRDYRIITSSHCWSCITALGKGHGHLAAGHSRYSSDLDIDQSDILSAERVTPPLIALLNLQAHRPRLSHLLPADPEPLSSLVRQGRRMASRPDSLPWYHVWDTSRRNPMKHYES